jgi:PAS domain S-box-containing protein
MAPTIPSDQKPKPPAPSAGRSEPLAEPMPKTLRELRAHLAELEKQNAELRQAQAERNTMRMRYYDLYDHAPVGHCTLGPQGLILEANHTAATLLGVPWGGLIQQPFARFISPEDQEVCSFHHGRLFETGTPRECELRMRKADDTLFWAFLKATAAQAPDGTPVCHVVINDITERKRAELALQASEARNQAFIRAIPDIIFTNRRDGEYLAVHAPDPSRLIAPPETILHRTIHDFLPPPIADQCMAAIAAALDRGAPQELTYSLNTQNGLQHFEARVAPCTDDTAITIVRDITERKRAEEALRHRETRFRELIDFAVDGILLGSPEGIITDANACMCVLTGRPRENLIGHHILDLFDPDTLQETPMRFDLLLQGETVVRQRKIIRPDRSAILVEMHTKMMPDGTYQSIYHDITARKRAEAALQKSECLLRETQAVAHLGSYALDIPTGAWESSDGLDLVLGTSPDSEHSVATWVALLHPDDRDRMEAYFENEVLGKGRNFDREYRIIRPSDQSMRWVHGLGRLELDARGRPVKMIGTIQDISVRKQAEQEKNRLEADLQQARKMESIGRLAGGVAHDFNNMLMVILGNAELALESMDPSQPAYADIEEIRKAAERSTHLTRQLLAFARKQTIAPRILDLNQTVQGMLQMLHRLIGENISIDWRPALDLGPVKMDPAQIDQILANLCLNARDAIAGVGTITIETAGVSIDEADGAASGEIRPRRIRPPCGPRHRRRHEPGGPRTPLRTVLHQQGLRQGHRPRPGHGLWHRQAEPRLYSRREYARPGHGLSDLPAAASGPRLSGNARESGRPRRTGR